MSSKSKQQLKLDNQTNFPNNNNGFITPDKLRNFHVDIIDSFLTQDGLDTLSTELQTEVSERILADQSLSTAILQSGGGGEAISQEISNRISGDQSLSTSISIEKSQRVSSDLSLTTLLSSDYIPYTGANKDVNLGDHTLAVDGIKLDTTTPYVVQNPGEIGWNQVEGTVDLRLLNNTTLQLGQEIHTYGRAVGNILNGDPVQFAGVQGDHILIKTANAIEIEQNPYLLIGISTQNIINGKFGYVTYFGKVNGIFTEDWVSKDEIYFDPILNGLTNQKPNVPNRIIKVGYLIKAQTGGAENGILKVKISYGTRLTDLDDVNGTTPTKGTFPIFQDEGYFDFSTNINDYALVSSLSTETSARISSDSSLTSRISAEEITRSTGLSTEMSQRISTDASLTSELSLTTAIAKGAQQALSFQNYEGMVSYLNTYLEEPLTEQTHVGQSIYIRTLDVPDIWISGNNFPSIIPTPYNFVSDEQLIADVVAGNGSLLMGFYRISFLETQKVDLTNYVTNTELSTAISTEASDRISTDISLSTALSTEISERISADLSLSTAIENIPVGGEEVEITKEFVLGNDSDAGDLMMLNTDDGKVYSAESYGDKTFSTATTQYYTGTTYSDDLFKKIKTTISDDGSKVAFYYWDNGLNLVLKIGIINEDLSITYGESQIIEIPSQLSEYGNPQGVVFLPNNNNKLLVGYTAPYTYSFCIRVITLDGISITNIGSKNVISTLGYYGYGDIIFDPFNDDNFMVFITGPNRFGLKYMNIDNNNNLSIISTFDYHTTFVDHGQDSRFIFDPLVKNRFIISGMNGSGWSYHRIFVFNMISDVYLYTISEAPFNYSVCSVDFDPFTKDKIIYSYNSYDVLYMRVATIGSDSKITFGDQNTIATNIHPINPRSYYSKNIKNEIISLVSDSTLQYTKLIVSAVSDSTVSFVNSYDVRSEQTQLYLYPSFCKNKPNLVLFSCTTTSNTNIYAVATQLPFINVVKYDYLTTIGFLTETGIEGETKKVRFLGGIDYNKSGLTLGEKYYVQQDGSVSNISSAYEYGKAISTYAIETISNNDNLLNNSINILNSNDSKIIEYVIAKDAELSVAIGNVINSLPSGYQFAYLGYIDNYSDNKNFLYIDKSIEIYYNAFITNSDGNVRLEIFNTTGIYSQIIIYGREVKKIMVYDKYVLIWCIFNSNNAEFNNIGSEYNECYLLNVETKTITSLGTNEITFFNYTDKLMYTRTLAGVHTIYDLKTQTPTTYTPGAGTIMFPKSDTQCYIMNGTTIGYYALSNLSTPIWTKTMPINSFGTIASATREIDFSPEYNLIFGRIGESINVYSTVLNTPTTAIQYYTGNLQLSKDIFCMRSDGTLTLFEMKTLNYIGKISSGTQPWRAVSNENAIYTLYNNIAAKFYI